MSIEETVQVIEKVRGIEGVVWNFEKEFTFKRSDMDRLRAYVKNWLCRKFWLSGKEVAFFDINLFPDSFIKPWEEELGQLSDRGNIVTMRMNFNVRSGIEIVRYGFNRGYATLKELEESPYNPQLVSLDYFGLTEEEYWLHVWDLTGSIYAKALNDGQLEKARQTQLSIIDMLKPVLSSSKD